MYINEQKSLIEPVSYGHRVGNGRHLALLEVLPDLIGQEEQETQEQTYLILFRMEKASSLISHLEHEEKGCPLVPGVAPPAGGDIVHGPGQAGHGY